MHNRIDFQEYLESIITTGKVYAQVPTSLSMSYPCIKYELSAKQTTKANNSSYLTNKRYQMTYISHDIDDPTVDKFDTLPNCSFDRHYVSDGLHHWVYSIYY